MAITGSLGFTWDAPVTLEGLMVQSESRVRLGTERLYGSLEVASPAYLTYGISLGLQAGQFYDLGLLSSLSFEQVPTYEEVEAANVRNSGIFILTEETMTITVGIFQFNPSVLAVAMGTATVRSFNGGLETVISVGDGCTANSRPLEIATQNIHCGAEEYAIGVDTRIRAIAITVYDAFSSGGLPWGDINAGALNTIDLEFQARSVLANERGNRFASIYVV